MPKSRMRIKNATLSVRGTVIAQAQAHKERPEDARTVVLTAGQGGNDITIEELLPADQIKILASRISAIENARHHRWPREFWRFMTKKRYIFKRGGQP